MTHQYIYESSELVGTWTTLYEAEKEIFRKERFSDSIELEFVSNNYPALAKYNEYLTQLYGVYMKPPQKNRLHIIPLIFFGNDCFTVWRGIV